VRLFQTTNEIKDDSDEPVKPGLSMVQVNYIGVIYTTKLAMHYFNKQDISRDRCLIIKGSLASYLDLPGGAEYQSSKFGVRGLMCCLRNSKRMRVNLLAPWWARTGILPEAAANYVDDMLKRIGSQWIHMEDAGKAALRIATDESIQGVYAPNSCLNTQLIQCQRARICPLFSRNG
jgi:short-subunit dehydrogenase